MTTRSKSILIIAGTLLIGLVIGALGAGAVIGSRIDQFERMRRPGGIPAMIEQAIAPTDEAQRRKIALALDSLDARQSRLREYTVVRHTAIFDSLRGDLDSILTPEQRTRLDEWETRDRGPRGGSGRPGPRGDRRGRPPAPGWEDMQPGR